MTTCKTSGKSFEKIKTEYDRIELKSENHYCSRSCCGKDNIKKKFGEFFGKNNNPKLPIKRDKFTGFREFIRRAKNRDKLGDLTLDDLVEQWNKQKGICPYTGIKLKLRDNHNIHVFDLASLDRIDSNKLYEKGNVVFVSTPINYMKNSMSVEETVAFCKKIALFWNK